MVLNYLHKVGWLFVLVLLQVLVLNNVHLAGYATPFLYIYLLLKFESDTSRNTLMLWGFALGLVVDIFSDTPGMHASATVLLGFLRPAFLRLFVPRDMVDVLVPSVRTLGLSAFLKYVSLSVFVHHAMLLCVEFFSFAQPATQLLRVVSSSILTVVCVMALEGMQHKRKS